MRGQYLQMGLLLAAGMAFASPALAAEQRCTELGANCVCSEPLNTTVLPVFGPFLNPGDSSDNECTVEYGQSTGLAILRTISPVDVFGSNDPVVLGRLPQRTSTLQYFVRAAEGYISEFSVGHTQYLAPTRTVIDALTPGTVAGRYISKARVAYRFYVYFSDTFTFAGDNSGLCTNGKRALFDQINLVHESNGNSIASYNYGWDLDSNGVCAQQRLAPGCGRFKLDGPGGSQWTTDCCASPGPSTSSTAVAPSPTRAYQGRWFMFEGVITNRFGPGYRLQVFMRNITDNLPEQQIIDTNGTYGEGPNGPWIPSAQLTPNEITTLANFYLGGKNYGYRAGVCPGWAGYSHFLMAQWDTNAGQRIGPAAEVEGGTFKSPPPGTPPPAPTNLRVISLWDQFLKMFSTLSRLLG